MIDFTYSTDVRDKFNAIRNIFCVGRNYRDHASELANAVPTEPMIFGKSTHALTSAKDVLVLPSNREEIHYEAEIVLFIGRPVVATSKALDVVTEVALGLDLTDRAAQSRLKEKGHPWEFAKSFVGSAVLTDFYRFETFDAVQTCTFSFSMDDKKVQVGQPTEMVFDFDTLIAYVYKHYGLSQGDILFTGTPAGVSVLRKQSRCALTMNDEVWASFVVDEKPEAGKGS